MMEAEINYSVGTSRRLPLSPPATSSLSSMSILKQSAVDCFMFDS